MGTKQYKHIIVSPETHKKLRALEEARRDVSMDETIDFLLCKEAAR